MKLNLLRILTIFTCLSLNGQISFEEHIITEIGPDDFSTGLSCIAIGDIDGDGDPDIVSAEYLNDQNLSWFENTDGLGDFSVKHLITDVIDIPLSIALGDIDNDGDLDVLWTDALDVIYWYENLDGAGNFGFGNLLTAITDGAYWSSFEDFDGDGWQDLVVADRDTDVIFWYKNNAGTLDPPIDLATIDLAYDGAIGHLNNDDHSDFVVIGLNGKIMWFDNADGLGGFQGYVLSTTSNGVTSVVISDFDQDGFNDIVYSRNAEGDIHWIRNLDNAGNFDPPALVIDNLGRARAVAAIDIEQDGDIDLAFVDSYAGRVEVLERLEGDMEFAPEIYISFTADLGFELLAQDLNNDSKIDLVVASKDFDRIAWLENTSVLSVTEFQDAELALFPNPTNGVVFIDGSVLVNEIVIYNQLGQQVLRFNETLGISQFSTLGLSAGLYYVQLIDQQGSIAVKKLVKR